MRISEIINKGVLKYLRGGLLESSIDCSIYVDIYREVTIEVSRYISDLYVGILYSVFGVGDDKSLYDVMINMSQDKLIKKYDIIRNNFLDCWSKSESIINMIVEEKVIDLLYEPDKIIEFIRKCQDIMYYPMSKEFKGNMVKFLYDVITENIIKDMNINFEVIFSEISELVSEKIKG